MPQRKSEPIYCMNCGSKDIEAHIDQSPSDDLMDYWCNHCSLYVDAGSPSPFGVELIKKKYARRLKDLERFLAE